MQPEEMARIYDAYLYGAAAHSNQKRISGEPYINHPIHVANTMAELRLDATTIAAALLHDVLEDTDITKQQLAARFGAEIDGVSKLPKLKFESKESGQAKNFQKMLLAMSNDARVILVKLSDRLHNVRTLHYLPRDKQMRIARETLDIYAPLAQRLGMDKMRLELEDMAFKALYPRRRRVLEKAVLSRGKRKDLVDKMIARIRARLDQNGLRYTMYARNKHLYSIYRKMKERKHSLDQIFDIFAVRIIVDEVDHCYRMLGLLHNLCRPLPGRFKDYIALPKPNGYQSLHTVLIDPQGIKLEVQIRTREMEEVAESGIAAHALYKSGESAQPAPPQRWLQNLLNLQQKTGNDSVVYMENLKAELFPAEVYVCTPQGKIIVLPHNSTALDFAFAIHTDIGLATSGVRVNGAMESLNFRLQSGQTVEVLTADNVTPDSGWLEFVVTAKARTAILHYLKSIAAYEAVELGRYLLQQALASYHYRLAEISADSIKKVLTSLDLKDDNELYKEIGLGRQLPSLIVARLINIGRSGTPLQLALEPDVVIKGTKGMRVFCAKCCYPIPGDAIIGALSPGKGLMIHRKGCTNIQHSKRAEIILLNWPQQSSSTAEYSVAIRIVVPHQSGVLATLAAKIAQTGSNIENVSLNERSVGSAAMTFVLSVRDKTQLDKIIRRMSQAYSGVKVARISAVAE